jgi:hypothetical protein
LVKSRAANFGSGTPELFQQMVQLVEQAVSLDENDIECHRIMCRIALIQGKFANSEYHLERALALNPNDARLNIICLRTMSLGHSRTSGPWYSSNRRQWSNGIAQAFEPTGGSGHAVPDGPRRATKSVT